MKQTEGILKINVDASEIDQWVSLGINGMGEKCKKDFGFLKAQFSKMLADEGFSLDVSGGDWVYSSYTLEFDIVK